MIFITDELGKHKYESESVSCKCGTDTGSNSCTGSR